MEPDSGRSRGYAIPRWQRLIGRNAASGASLRGWATRAFVVKGPSLVGRALAIGRRRRGAGAAPAGDAENSRFLHGRVGAPATGISSVHRAGCLTRKAQLAAARQVAVVRGRRPLPLGPHLPAVTGGIAAGPANDEAAASGQQVATTMPPVRLARDTGAGQGDRAHNRTAVVGQWLIHAKRATEAPSTPTPACRTRAALPPAGAQPLVTSGAMRVAVAQSPTAATRSAPRAVARAPARALAPGLSQAAAAGQQGDTGATSARRPNAPARQPAATARADTGEFSVAAVNPQNAAHIDNAASVKTGDMSGDVYLDGRLVGRWLTNTLGQAANRRPKCGAGFDIHQNVPPPGMTSGLY